MNTINTKKEDSNKKQLSIVEEALARLSISKKLEQYNYSRTLIVRHQLHYASSKV